VVFFYFNSPQLLPTGHVAALEASCARRQELEPWGHVAVSELSCVRSRGHGARGGPGAFVGPGGGSWSHEARGDSEAALCQETGVGATGHVAVSELPRVLVAGAGATRHVAARELPCARRRELWDTQACAPILSFVLT
jgi:hypothetical protein